MDYQFQCEDENEEQTQNKKDIEQNKVPKKKTTDIPFKKKKMITNAMRGLPHFTHFMSLPFIRKQYRGEISSIQNVVKQKFEEKGFTNVLREHSCLLGHITLFMLTLKLQQTKIKVMKILKQSKAEISQIIGALCLKMGNVKYFTRVNKNQKCDQITVIYLDLDDQQNQKKLTILIDYLIRKFLAQQILIHEELKSMHIIFDHNQNLFKAEALHMSLFRCNDLMVRDKVLETFKQINQKIESKEIIFNSDFIDVSTMLEEHDEDGFYHPLIRLNIGQK